MALTYQERYKILELYTQRKTIDADFWLQTLVRLRNESKGLPETVIDYIRYDDRRESHDYYEWMSQVFELDDFKCLSCGATTDLEVHHVKSYARYEAFRLDVGNGAILCKSCHKGYRSDV